MKKRKEKKKVIDSNNRQKQLSLHSFFASKSIEIHDALLDSSESILKVNETPSKNNVKVDSYSNPTSPDVIDGTPQTKVISISRLSSEISLSDDAKLTPPKKKLFVDTSNSINKEFENVDVINEESHTNKHSEHNCNTLLEELFEELENSPPKKQSQSPVSSKDKLPESFISLSKNKKRLKLSLSTSLKKNTPPSGHSINRPQKSCDTNSNDKLHLPKIQFKSNQRESKKFLDVNTCADIFKNEAESKIDAVSQVIKCETTNCDVPNKFKDFNFMDIENLDALFSNSNDSCDISNELCLDEWKYCEIISIENEKHSIKAKFREAGEKRNSSVTSCLIKGYWSDFPFNIGDVVSVKARFDVPLSCWVIDHEYGFIVKHPDILMTGTGIVESLFCLRRAVLSYLFPGNDPPNLAMLIGSLVHELLQEILRKKIYSDAEIEKVAVNLVKSQRILFSAYECGVALSTLLKELNNFLPRISSFIRTYIRNQSDHWKTWAGLINEILSIEENFWIPQLGIKGKTDLIVKATKDGRIRTMPVELKTGRVSNAVEHRGQIILYLMMMSELGMNVDSGLLLYLKENVLNEIKPSRNEYTGLVSMRNNLVDYFIKNETMKLSSEKTFTVPVLPEPIHHHSGCAKCPYLTLCSAALTKETDVRLSDSNPLKKLSVNSIQHLSTNHIEYVFHWLGLLKLEEVERKRNRFSAVSDIWHVDESERHRRGFCISGLNIIDVQTYENKFLHRMKRNNDDFDFTRSDLEVGDYIVVSSNKRYALATGYVHGISKFSIVLKIDRQLNNKNILYTVDKYSATEGLLGFNTSSLLLLLENSATAERLRSFIIDLKLPQFLPIDKFVTKYSKMVSNKLNECQKKSILMALAAKDYILIKGMPGTGKTATIVALVKLLTKLNHTVLVTSHTHSAVDNILLRLRGAVEFLRLKSSVKVHPLLKSYCDDSILKNQNFNTMEDLENFYDSKPVVGVTCMGCSHILLKKRTFDYCIVDEATQVLQPSVLKALFSSRKFVLLGDPDQLPPVVQNKEACRLGLSESLFRRLDRPEVVSTLSFQYRMNSEIMKLANCFTYDNQLQCNEESICSATIAVDNCNSVKFDWLRYVLSGDMKNSVVFLNTSHLTMPYTISLYSNQIEADLTCIITEAIIKNCKQNYEIGVIAPYREQVHLLKKTIANKNIDIEINTVDQYQGRDKDIIIFSCTRFCEQKASKGGGILDDKRRLTVAITRAKKKLIILGNKTVLETSSILLELLHLISVENIIDVLSY